MYQSYSYMYKKWIKHYQFDEIIYGIIKFWFCDKTLDYGRKSGLFLIYL